MKLCRATHVFTGLSLTLAGAFVSTTCAGVGVGAKPLSGAPLMRETTLNTPDTEFASNG